MKYAATIGFFDGVHLGHHFLIQQLQTQAAQRGLSSAIITFEEHPKQVLDGRSPALLTTFDERVQRLKQEGVNEIFCFHFELVQGMTAEEFMRILHTQCDIEVLLMGYDHRFGSDHLCEISAYQTIGQAVGVEVLPVTCAPEGTISSSKIRQALQEGHIEDANRMLGYPYTLQGEVVHGHGLGQHIGFPTANIATDTHKLLPCSGVYAGTVDVAEKQQRAVINIGTNPTVGNNLVSVEMHLPDYEGDLYGQALTVRLERFIRAEKKFATLEELTQQIRIDINGTVAVP